MIGPAGHLWRVIWPEGEPQHAVTVGGIFERWWLSFRWSLRGKRTCSAFPISNHERGTPTIVARRCERAAK